MTAELTDAQRETLRAFCDTIVPRVERADDPDGFFARTATDLEVDRGVEELLASIPDPVIREGMVQLLDVLDDSGLRRAPSPDPSARLPTSPRRSDPSCPSETRRRSRPTSA